MRSSLGPLPGTTAAGEPRSRPRAWPPPWAPSTHCQLQEGPRGLGAVESSSGWKDTPESFCPARKWQCPRAPGLTVPELGFCSVTSALGLLAPKMELKAAAPDVPKAGSEPHTALERRRWFSWFGIKIPSSGREGQDGETHIHPWLIHVNVWQKPTQYCKVISLQLKLKNK